MSDRSGSWVGSILTVSGAEVNLIDPAATADAFTVEDVAHALGNVCRYGGHVPHFYSVAEHSVRVCRSLSAHPYDIQLSGLLHDAAEAYIGDMVRPLKQTAEVGTAYQAIEQRLNEVLIPALGGSYSPLLEFGPEVAHADHEAYVWELDNIRTGVHCGWSPHFARDEFLREYNRLCPF